VALLQFYLPWGTQEAFDLANVRATRRLGEWAVAWGVRNFIHISSPSLYFDYHHHRDIQEDFRPAVLPVSLPAARRPAKR
jgi:nucleoside-diphosphate-sugar epimerase